MGETLALPMGEDAKRLARLAELKFNYDAQKFSASHDRLGWKIDKYRARIASERPGPPEADGPFRRACRTVEEYRFPDPRLITAIFNRDGKLEGRDMLLKAHFAWLTFYFGVRIVDVFDQNLTSEDGHPVHLWGYAYRTLQGHFEIGEIRFLVSKDLTSGEIFFEIDAYSKPERIPNFFYRIGFMIFGRRLQKRFAQTSLRRIALAANGTANL